jgi:DNA ligase-1
MFCFSEKMDGIRALIFPDMKGIYSRTGRVLPNPELAQMFGELQFVADRYNVVLDGELWRPDSTYSAIQSCIMSKKGSPAALGVQFHAFDCIPIRAWHGNAESVEYRYRYRDLDSLFRRSQPANACVVETLLLTYDDGLTYFEKVIQRGGEGLIGRAQHSPYKHGRSTASEGYMFKLKEFNDAEATVIGFIAKTEIDKTAKRSIDPLGRPAPVYKSGERVAVDELGSLQVRTDSGLVFCIGSGFTHAQRVQFWEDRALLIGKRVTYKSMKHGAKVAPRHPVFLYFREDGI